MELEDDHWNRFISRAIGDLPIKESEAAFYALFFYQSDVNNGGHLQYFLNWPMKKDWYAAATAARQIGQEEMAANFERARRCWEQRPRQEPNTDEDYVEQALESEFDAFDARFYELEAGLQSAFELAVADSEEG